MQDNAFLFLVIDSSAVCHGIHHFIVKEIIDRNFSVKGKLTAVGLRMRIDCGAIRNGR